MAISSSMPANVGANQGSAGVRTGCSAATGPTSAAGSAAEQAMVQLWSAPDPLVFD